MRLRGLIGLLVLAAATAACGELTPTAEPSALLEASVAPTSSSSPAIDTAPATATASGSQAAVEPTTPIIPRGVWLQAASMGRERHGFDAVMLGDGTVLVVGSDWDCVGPDGALAGSETAEIYDREADTWTQVESLNKPRALPATVSLRDGSAMVIGGFNADSVPFSSTKIFAPWTQTWTDGPLLDVARSRPLDATLADGRVLVVSLVQSRTDGASWRTTAELFDPHAGIWSTVASPPPRIELWALVVLTDGRVLGTGIDGTDSDPAPTTLLYDPAKDTWVFGANSVARFGYELVGLRDGGALAIGGAGGGELWGDTRPIAPDVSRFDPRESRWNPVTPMSVARRDVGVAVLPDGRVVVAGGTTLNPAGDEIALGLTEAYDPGSNTWSAYADLGQPRYEASLVSLDDGSALIVGGYARTDNAGETPFCAEPLTSVERIWP